MKGTQKTQSYQESTCSPNCLQSLHQSKPKIKMSDIVKGTNGLNELQEIVVDTDLLGRMYLVTYPEISTATTFLKRKNLI